MIHKGRSCSEPCQPALELTMILEDKQKWQETNRYQIALCINFTPRRSLSYLIYQQAIENNRRQKDPYLCQTTGCSAEQTGVQVVKCRSYLLHVGIFHIWIRYDIAKCTLK